MRATTALTNLDRVATGRRLEGVESLARVAVVGAGALAVEVAGGFAPGEVVDDAEAVAPEDGGGMGERGDEVDVAGELGRPRTAATERSARPGG